MTAKEEHEALMNVLGQLLDACKSLSYPEEHEHETVSDAIEAYDALVTKRLEEEENSLLRELQSQAPQLLRDE